MTENEAPLPQQPDSPASVPPPVDAPEPLAPKWTRPAATTIRRIADVLAHPGRTVPLSDEQDDRPYFEWQAAAIQKVMHEVIDTAWRAGVAEGRRQLDEEIKSRVLTSARAAAEAFGPVPDSVTVSYERVHGSGVTLKGCLGVSAAHGKGDLHWWPCSTPGCVGHICDERAAPGDSHAL